MTVCIGAIYNNNTIIGASDRMLTAGDIQFQPHSSKIWRFSNSILVMVSADDISVQNMIFQDVYKVVNDRIKAEPNNWWKVKDVAELYSDHYCKLKLTCIKKEILGPFALNNETFISRQKEMSEEFIGEMVGRIRKYSIPHISTILAGCDENGAHLYVINDEDISCHDSVGFVAIGAGAGHAESHFMLSGYHPGLHESKALLTVHQAKKKAEVAPGVGKETDMFIIGPRLGIHFIFPGDLIDSLDKFYKEYKNKIDTIDKKNQDKIDEFIKRYAKERAEDINKQNIEKPKETKKEEIKSPDN